MPLTVRIGLGLEAALALCRWSSVVKVAPGRRLTRRLGAPVPPLHGPGAAPGVEARRVAAAAVRVAGLLPWRPVCLPQALAVGQMLRRRGIEAESHLGVTGTDPFAAHAWVTVRGSVVIGRPVTHVTRLATFR